MSFKAGVGLLLLAAASACSRAATVRATPAGVAPSAASSAAPGVVPMENAELVDLVQRLGDTDSKRREIAENELRMLASAGVSRGEGAFLLRAAGKKYPPHALGLGSTQTDLINAAASKPDLSYVAIVKEIFPALEARPGQSITDARSSVFQLLADIDDERAARALIDLLEGAVASGAPPFFQLPKLESEPRFPEVYFPRMLLSAKGASRWGVFSLSLAYVQKGVIKAEQLTPHAHVLVEAFEHMRPEMVAAQAKPGTSWVWDTGYGLVREEMSLVLDLMGYVPASAFESPLREASKWKDARPAYFAAISLLRLGLAVDASILEHVAASAEMRSWLFAELKRQRKERFFPRKWAAQRALAESEMVRWLTFPTELGRAPDEIELMKVVSEDFGEPDGVIEWYLFRFRTRPPHWAAEKGWMSGVAGPFKKADAPSADAYGDTFSSFTPWSSKKPDEHVAEIRELIDAWREHSGHPSK